MARFPADTICCLLFAMVPAWGANCNDALVHINVKTLKNNDDAQARCDGYCEDQVGSGWVHSGHWWQAWQSGSSEGGSFCQCAPLCDNGGGAGHLPAPLPSPQPAALAPSTAVGVFGYDYHAGACRTSANGYGTFTAYQDKTMGSCQSLCDSIHCVAFEYNRGRCEIHTTAITHGTSSPSHVNCFVKQAVAVVQKLGSKYYAYAGACRTRSNGYGTFTVHRNTTTSSCSALCDADLKCVAYEYNRGYCEIHTTEITHGTGSPSHVNCFVKQAVVTG